MAKERPSSERGGGSFQWFQSAEARVREATHEALDVKANILVIDVSDAPSAQGLNHVRVLVELILDDAQYDGLVAMYFPFNVHVGALSWYIVYRGGDNG